MIPVFRAFLRLVCFFLVSLITVIVVAAGNLLLGIFNREWAVSWKNRVIKSWAWMTGFIIGLRLTKKGEPPEPPFFLVSNHLSYIDVVLLWRYLDATFVAKSEVKSWPFFGWGTRTLGVLFIDRDLKRDVRRMNERISQNISDRQGVILFPEGTSTKGEEVASFNASLLQYPAEREMPVHYASLSYRTSSGQQPAERSVCWWGDMEFIPHFWNLLKLKRFSGSITFGESPVVANDRKELGEKLRAAVLEGFVPVVEDSR